MSTTVLTTADQVSGFCCDRESVNEWLHTKALNARPNVVTTLYVAPDSHVVAFAATTMSIVNVVGGTSAQRAGARDGQSVGFLLAQMAVRSDQAGGGIGGAVLRDVMASAARSYREAPFPLFIVDAADEPLVGYYERFGLRRLAGQLRLVAPMRQIVKSLATG